MDTADAAGWRRFTQVTQSVPGGHKLYRASSPNYINKDSDQRLTQAAVDFLVSQGVDSIISLNEHEYTHEEKARLANAAPPIRYLHLKLGDFRPPTLAQFEQARHFFLQNASTLVHCGYGWGRTGTCVTGLQIYTENGQTLQPPGKTWVLPLAFGGNNVEKRAQVSILAQLRNLLFPRVTGKLLGDPKQTFAIVNFATGYYLTLAAENGRVIAVSPEMVETSSTIRQPLLEWEIRSDKGNYTLTNNAAPDRAALTDPQGAEVDDPVTYGALTGESAQFTIMEVESGSQGRYVISPYSSPTLAVAINTPDDNVRLPQSGLMPALLATRDESNEFGLWILLSTDFIGRKDEA